MLSDNRIILAIARSLSLKARPLFLAFLIIEGINFVRVKRYIFLFQKIKYLNHTSYSIEVTDSGKISS